MKIKVDDPDMARELDLPYKEEVEITSIEQLETLFTRSSEPIAFNCRYHKMGETIEVCCPYDF